MRVENFICPEQGDHRVFPGISDIMRIPRWNIHYLRSRAVHFIFNQILSDSGTELNPATALYHDKLLRFCMMKMIAAGDARQSGGKKYLAG